MTAGRLWSRPIRRDGFTDVAKFGCCTYRGAADRGGMGWIIVDEKSHPPVIPGTYERDEQEQVRHLRDV